MEIGQSSTGWHNEKFWYCFIKSKCRSPAYSYTWWTWLIFLTKHFYRIELKPILQWNDDSTRSQCKATFSTSYSISPSLSSLDLIACVEGALCKTRDVIHLQPSCVSIDCSGLSLLYCSQSITKLLWVALHPCSFSLLLLFHRGCAIASATLLLTLGHQGNFHPTGMSASSDGFWGNTKKLGICEVQHKQ